MKYFAILYLVLIFFSPYIGGSYRLDILISIFIIPFLYPFFKHETKYVNSILKLAIPFLIFLLFSSFTYVIQYRSTGDLSFGGIIVAFLGQVRFFIIMYFFIIIIHNKIISVNFILKFLFFSVFIFSIIGLLQTFSPVVNSILIKYYTKFSREETIEMLISLRYFRPFSIVGHPALYSIVLLLTLVYILNYYSKLKGAFKVFSILLVVLILYLGLISGSKTFYLGILLYSAYFLFSRRSIRYASLVTFSAIMLFYYLIIIIKVIDIPYIDWTYYQFIEKGIGFAFETRFGEKGILVETIRFIQDTSYLGTGLLLDKNAFYGDNLYLVLILRLSIVGAFVFIGTLFYWDFKFYKLYKKTNNVKMGVITDSIFIYFITGVGIPSIFGNRMMEYFAILIAIGLTELNKQHISDKQTFDNSGDYSLTR